MRRKPLRVVLAIVLAAVAFWSGLAFERWHGHDDDKPAGKGAAARPSGYHCPMHPNFRSDKPGDCGICGMKLVPDEAPAQPAAGAERTPLYYRDPKDPDYRAHTPGVNPETGNDLEPVYADDAGALPPGTIRVAPEKQQLIGVQYGVVEQEAGGRTIRANGRVVADERRVARVQTKIEGWIEKVYADFTGKLVEKGQPLLTLYSPEMLATQQEYLLAIKSREILRNSSIDSVRGDGNGLVEAARRRLELWDLSAGQIRQIEQSGKPLTNITLHAPISGYITVKNALPNQRITPETELYTIVDLSRVWVMADLFEYEAGAIRPGQRAIVSAAAFPGQRFPATVTYIQPQFNAETRTLQVRLELANTRLALKPDMFVDVELELGGAQRLVVPVNAVLNSGLRQTVYIDRGNGFLEPRPVKTGKQFGGKIEVLEGLRAGERIVTSGTFLIDSESQLQSSASGAPASATAPAAAEKPAAEHRHD